MQKTVTKGAMPTGVVGEFFATGDRVTQTLFLDSTTEALNKIGSVVLFKDGEDEQAGVAADGAFAGIVCNPRSLVQQGLEPDASIANGTPVEVARKGFLVVSLPAAAAIGDFVYFDDADGTLKTGAPDAAAPAASTRLPGGTVQYFNVAEAGVAVIYFDFAGDVTIGSV